MNKQNKGFTLVELLVVIGILGILMGALFPTIASAMLNANTNAMAMRGRNLFVAITQANTEREAAGLSSVWPQEPGEGDSGLDSEEAQLINAGSTTDYFKYLFDVQNSDNSAKWRPYVDCDMGVLAGGGVPGASGKSMTKNNIAWLVCKNVQSEMADVIPVLVSRNVDYNTLNSMIGASYSPESSGGGSGNDIDCGNGKGESDVPFGNKAWVLVRKGGASQVIKARYSKPSVVFNRTGFDNSNLDKAPKFMGL